MNYLETEEVQVAASAHAEARDRLEALKKESWEFNEGLPEEKGISKLDKIRNQRKQSDLFEQILVAEEELEKARLNHEAITNEAKNKAISEIQPRYIQATREFHAALNRAMGPYQKCTEYFQELCTINGGCYGAIHWAQFQKKWNEWKGFNTNNYSVE